MRKAMIIKATSMTQEQSYRLREQKYDWKQIQANLVLVRGGTLYQQGKEKLFKKFVWDNQLLSQKKKSPCFPIFTKINSSQIKELDIQDST